MTAFLGLHEKSIEPNLLVIPIIGGYRMIYFGYETDSKVFFFFLMLQVEYAGSGFFFFHETF